MQMCVQKDLLRWALCFSNKLKVAFISVVALFQTRGITCLYLLAKDCESPHNISRQSCSLHKTSLTKVFQSDNPVQQQLNQTGILIWKSELYYTKCSDGSFHDWRLSGRKQKTTKSFLQKPPNILKMFTLVSVNLGFEFKSTVKQEEKRTLLFCSLLSKILIMYL